VGDFLHGVARRIALSARAAAARRRAKERAVARPAVREDERNDWSALLDDELCRLPEKYRVPVVLCDLEGRTRREAAGQLGWPEGTVAGRLARGRELLAKRLLSGAQTLSGVLPATLAPRLVISTAQAATAMAGKGAVQGVLSPAALTLAQGVMQTMLWNKL